MKHTKIAVIGAGSVGSTSAYSLLMSNIAAEIILVDIDKKRCKGQIMDLNDSLAFSSSSKIIEGATKDAKNADIIIIAAGQSQRPGQKRQDLLENNKKIIESIMKDLTPVDKDTIIIMVTNPVDTMTHYAQQLSNLPKNQIIGSGTFLDTQRLKGFLTEKLKISEKSINAFVVGEHGDLQLVAWSQATVSGVPLKNFPEINNNILNQIEEKTRKKAYDIIDCKGSTYFGIASCITSICKSIIYNQNRIIPTSVYVEKLKTYIGMPAIIGNCGVKKIIDLQLNKQEEEKLKESAEKIISTLQN